MLVYVELSGVVQHSLDALVVAQHVNGTVNDAGEILPFLHDPGYLVSLTRMFGLVAFFVGVLLDDVGVLGYARDLHRRARAVPRQPDHPALGCRPPLVISSTPARWASDRFAD